jgi:hypothetical protein
MFDVGFADGEESGSELETQPLMRSSTPTFSDHASDSEKEPQEQDETKDGEELSDKRHDEHAEQELNDNSGDYITDRAPYSDNHSAVPPIDYPIPHVPAATVENAPAVENKTEAPNRRPKRVIKPRVQADQATIDDSDCANSDCDNPKRPGELIMCAGLGCQMKVCACFVHVSFD